jgi:hypothetical protein
MCGSLPRLWTEARRLCRAAGAIGSSTLALVTLIVESRPHPEQAFEAASEFCASHAPYGRERLEAACRRGLAIGTRSYGSIGSILQNGLDRCAPCPPTLTQLHQLGLTRHGPGLHDAGSACCSITRSPSASPAPVTARLRHQATVEDVDYRTPRGLDRALFQALAGGQWIAKAQKLIIEKPTGVGKTWLACALAHSVIYHRSRRSRARARRGRHPRLMRALGGVKLLVLDDWGLEPNRSGPSSAAICSTS